MLVLSACSSGPPAIHRQEPYTGIGQNSIYIVNHGLHTGFVIPALSIQAAIPELKTRFKNVPYIEFGWGDKGFYQAKEITTGLTIRAIFWPTESVIHAAALPAPPDSYFPYSKTEKVCLTDGELASLIRFISNSFRKDATGAIFPLKSGLYGDSQFYAGVGDYYLMNTCNKWTAKGLRSVGMDISPAFKLTAGSIMNYLKELSSHTGKKGCDIR